jgi:hypothetical protein
MKPVLYGCPTTGKMVQHFVTDEPNLNDERSYEPVDCLSCSSLHFVNREREGLRPDLLNAQRPIYA